VISVDVLLNGNLERDSDGNVIMKDTWSSCTLVRSGGNIIVADASQAYMRSPIIDSLRRLKVRPEEVDVVLLTHAHPDHTGCLGLFKNADIIKMEGEAIPKELEKYDIEVVSGETNICPGVDLVPTPGHTKDSASIFVESDHRYAIAGDAIPKQSNLEKRVPPRLNCDPEQAMRSMERIAQWADVVVPGHGGAFPVGSLKRLYNENRRRRKEDERDDRGDA
jgi:glyoxylase-like metal-dependent hydrolase (beta-lactamase superfamily II)